MTLSELAKYQNLLVQPVAVPDLEHTGLRTAFVKDSGATTIKPDGSSCMDLRYLIRSRVR
jgi:hypothetical protein